MAIYTVHGSKVKVPVIKIIIILIIIKNTEFAHYIENVISIRTLSRFYLSMFLNWCFYIFVYNLCFIKKHLIHDKVFPAHYGLAKDTTPLTHSLVCALL